MGETVYKPFNEFFLRTPIYPINNFFNIPDVLEPFIKDLVSNDYFLMALYLGSRDLYNRAVTLSTKNESSVKDEKLLRSIFKYWLRMSTRPTPFGMFAGNSMGNLHDETRIIVDDCSRHCIHSNLDMYLLSIIYEKLNEISAIRNHVKFFPNSSIFSFGSKLRYLEYKVKTTDRIYSIAEVEHSSHLQRILEGSINGANISQLVKLVSDESIAEEEAYDFVLETIEAQLLVSELDLNVTGTSYLQLLIEKIAGIPETESFVTTLRRINDILKQNRFTLKDFELIEQYISFLIQLPTVNLSLIHADLFVSTTVAHLDKGLVQSIVGNFAKLLDILPNSEPDRLKIFRDRFMERYENRTVPLMHALDPEIGVGYNDFVSSSIEKPMLLDKIDFLSGHSNETEKLSDFSKFINGQVYECLKNGKTEIELTDEHLQRFSFKGSKITPDTMYIKGVLINDLKADLNPIKFVLLDFNSASTATMIGRFCHGSTQFESKVLEYHKIEESFNSDTIFAEVAHIDNTRHGNITARPQLRDFEIPYLANTVGKRESKITVDDLHIRVINKEIILWSQKHDRRVMPKLTNAHNYKSGIPAYSFLCDLQFQNLHYETLFNWSDINNSLDFLPRVVYKNIVIAKARWKIRDITNSLNKYSNDQLLAYFKDISEKQKLPRFVVINQGDNNMPIDLHNIHCLRILAEMLTKHRQVIIHEFPFNAEICLVRDVHGMSFANEVIIPFCKVKKSIKRKVEYGESQDLIQRKFIVGSEWLYLKMFCGVKAAEEILTEIVKPFTDSLIGRQVIDQWFFIRFNLPENHLRIRFHGHKMFWSQIIEELKLLLEPLTSIETVNRYEVDTYVREIERYGNSMVESERLFYFDSSAVVNFLAHGGPQCDDSMRWLFALRGIDAILNDFDLSLTSKKNLLNVLRDNFFDEFKGDKNLKIQLDSKYREQMKRIAQYMDEGNDLINGFEEAAIIIKKRSNCICPVVGILKTKISNGLGLNDLIGSHIHMFLNRLLISNHRRQELVIYHFLAKYYDSKLAKQQKTNTDKVFKGEM